MNNSKMAALGLMTNSPLGYSWNKCGFIVARIRLLDRIDGLVSVR